MFRESLDYRKGMMSLLLQRFRMDNGGYLALHATKIERVLLRHASNGFFCGQHPNTQAPYWRFDVTTWKHARLQDVQRLADILTSRCKMMYPICQGIIPKVAMSWILHQLSLNPTGERAEVKCNIQKAIEWFLLAMYSLPAGKN